MVLRWGRNVWNGCVGWLVDLTVHRDTN